MVLMLLLQTFVSRSRLGRAMRATAQDREASALMGVDANQTIALTFLLGGCLARRAGVVWGLRFGYVRFDLGFNSGLKAFTAAVLGRHRQHHRRGPRRVHHRFIENMASALGYSRWSEFLVFMILTFVLIFKPTGILGQPREIAHDRRRPRPRVGAVRHARASATSPSHRRLAIIVGCHRRHAYAHPAQVPDRCRSVQRRAVVVRRVSPMRACSPCWRWGLNVVVGLAVCSTSAMPRFSPSARTPTLLELARTRARTCRSCRCGHRRCGCRHLRHRPGRADAAPARRLPRDHDPRVRRDRPDRLPQPGTRTEGTNGIGGIYRPEPAADHRHVSARSPRSPI
jgi:hypothetical protein